jgi:hypothetical protein
MKKRKRPKQITSGIWTWVWEEKERRKRQASSSSSLKKEIGGLRQVVGRTWVGVQGKKKAPTQITRGVRGAKEGP